MSSRLEEIVRRTAYQLNYHCFYLIHFKIPSEIGSLQTMAGNTSCDNRYESCSFSDVRRSIKQEADVRFNYNIHIPKKWSPPHRTHSPSRLRQDRRHLESRMDEMCGALNLLLLRGPEYGNISAQASQLFFEEGEQLKGPALLRRSQRAWVCGFRSALGSIFLRHS